MDIAGTLKKLANAKAKDVMKAVRSKLLPPGAEPELKQYVEATPTGNDNDWRVSLSVPTSMMQSPLLQPFAQTGNKLVFPLTPTINMEQIASYSFVHPTHTNYAFPVYQHSGVNEITIIGEFIVENPTDAAYWIAAVHYLRSITKMFYGEGQYQGAPPPVVKLNGYGDFVFNNIPVVISRIQTEMPGDVDYIKVGKFLLTEQQRMLQDQDAEFEDTPQSNLERGWVPTRSTISVTCIPTYSRSQVAKFNMQDFINGAYVTPGKGGFI
jgi:hypothetical protein